MTTAKLFWFSLWTILFCVVRFCCVV